MIVIVATVVVVAATAGVTVRVCVPLVAEPRNVPRCSLLVESARNGAWSYVGSAFRRIVLMVRFPRVADSL